MAVFGVEPSVGKVISEGGGLEARCAYVSLGPDWRGGKAVVEVEVEEVWEGGVVVGRVAMGGRDWKRMEVSCQGGLKFRSQGICSSVGPSMALIWW